MPLRGHDPQGHHSEETYGKPSDISTIDESQAVWKWCGRFSRMQVIVGTVSQESSIRRSLALDVVLSSLFLASNPYGVITRNCRARPCPPPLMRSSTLRAFWKAFIAPQHRVIKPNQSVRQVTVQELVIAHLEARRTFVQDAPRNTFSASVAELSHVSPLVYPFLMVYRVNHPPSHGCHTYSLHLWWKDEYIW